MESTDFSSLYCVAVFLRCLLIVFVVFCCFRSKEVFPIYDMIGLNNIMIFCRRHGLYRSLRTAGASTGLCHLVLYCKHWYTWKKSAFLRNSLPSKEVVATFVARNEWSSTTFPTTVYQKQLPVFVNKVEVSLFLYRQCPWRRGPFARGVEWNGTMHCNSSSKEGIDNSCMDPSRGRQIEGTPE